MILHFHFHFKSFPGHTQKRERTRERKRAPPHADSGQPSTPSDLATAPIHLTPVTLSSAKWSPIPHSSPITEPNDADPRWVRAQTDTDPDQRTRSNSASRSPVQPVRSSSQTQTHGEFFETGWTFYTFDPHTHLTSDPHTSNPHTHLTSDPHISLIHIPSNLDMPKSTTHPPGSDLYILYMYIYIYINIYIIIYFFIY